MKKKLCALFTAAFLGLSLFAGAGFAAEPEEGTDWTDYVLEFSDEYFAFRSFLGEDMGNFYLRKSTEDEWSNTLSKVGTSSYDIRFVGDKGGVFLFFGLPLGNANRLNLYSQNGFDYAQYVTDKGETVTTTPVLGYEEPVELTVSETLNVRSTPDTSKTRIGTVSTNAKVKAYGEADGDNGFKWYLVRYNKGYGFLSGQYLRDADGVPVQPTPTPKNTRPAAEDSDEESEDNSVEENSEDEAEENSGEAEQEEDFTEDEAEENPESVNEGEGADSDEEDIAEPSEGADQGGQGETAAAAEDSGTEENIVRVESLHNPGHGYIFYLRDDGTVVSELY